MSKVKVKRCEDCKFKGKRYISYGFCNHLVYDGSNWLLLKVKDCVKRDFFYYKRKWYKFFRPR